MLTFLVACASVGCAGCAAADPCGAVYDALVADLGATFASTGTRVTFPPAAEFHERCAALGLSDEQLACLQPSHGLADPAGCRAAIDPVRPQVDQLADWFGQNTHPADDGADRAVGTDGTDHADPGAQP